jgi:3-phosphoshikimate 1-carboxyvinyltransferase
MIAIIQPSDVLGSIQAPASKSSMQRACAAALLSKGETLIRNPGHSSDDKAALGVIKGLGAQVEMLEGGGIRVISKGVNPVRGELNCGESGLGIRMFAPIIALSDREIIVTGEGSLLSRPMEFFDTVFPQLGITVGSNAGKLPLRIRGPLQPRPIEIDGSLSSQFLTGLLMAYAAAGANGVTISVNNLKSKPYIDLTLDVMKRFGWNVGNRDYKEFYFADPKPGTGKGTIDYQVEGDWSGSAFLLVAAAIGGHMRIRGLDIHSTQADKAILQALTDCGVHLDPGPDQIEIAPPEEPLAAFHFDATDCPDLFPPLVALAAYCAGTTVIEGVGRLAHKESNRALTLQEEFGKMGVGIRLEGDRMMVMGGEGATAGRIVKGATVHSRHDHRIAMACAVAGLQAQGETIIEEAQAVNKSYPDFYEHLRLLGAEVATREAINNEP